MCRNIRPLNNFDPPATDAELHDAALQFVRKIAGSTKPSNANVAAYDKAVELITAASRELIDSLVTSAPPKNREEEADKARARSAARYSTPGEAASPVRSSEYSAGTRTDAAS